MRKTFTLFYAVLVGFFVCQTKLVKAQNNNLSKNQTKTENTIGIADFESIELSKESTSKQTVDGTYSFTDNGFEFTHTISYNGDAWNGFVASNKTNKTEAGSLINAYTSATGTGADGSKNYAVSFIYGESKIKVKGSTEGEKLNGVYITNNTYTINSMENGDAYAKKFGGDDGTAPDWFKLEVFGYNKGEKTDSVELYLADFRSDKSEEDYILKEWKYLDLSKLGKVTELGFKLSSSDNGNYGMNTPSYFCLDNLNLVDIAPIVANAISDITVDINSNDSIINIENVFDDPDNNNEDIKITAQSTNTELVVPTIKDQKLTLAFAEGKFGQCSTTLTAESNGQTVKTSFRVFVEGKTEFGIADLEGYALQKESTSKQKADGTYSFTDNGFEFTHTISYNGAAWNGFLASNKTNNTEAGSFMNAYTSATGTGADNSKNYAVSFIYGEYKIKVKSSTEGEKLNGVYITNNTYAINSMENGDKYAKKFGGNNGTDPDWFKLEVFGYNKGEKTDSVELYLADFRSDKSDEDYILKDWKYLNLSKLGKVTELGFKLSSSDNGNYGMNTPAYFCLDNLNATKVAVEKETLAQTEKANIYPNPATDKLYVKTTFKANYVQIININGQVVKHEQLFQNEAINISELQKGIYIIKIVGNNKSAIQKLIKQ